jgi:N-acetylglucosaminyl-diphospho-decaprenol L-rhamnosyltransferase
MLSIITINYNNASLTVSCVDKTVALVEQSNVPFEVIVVDNRSTDDSFQELGKRVTHPNVRVVQSGRNGGFGFGNNIGVEYANYPYLWLLNSDAWCTRILDLPVLLEKLGAEKTGLISTVMADADGTIHPNGGAEVSFKYFLLSSFRVGALIRKNKWLKQLVVKFIPGTTYSKSYQHDQHQFRPAQVVSGASMLVSKKVYMAVGGFDCNFFLYDEDTDLCYRIAKQGYTNYTTNLLEVQTVNHSSTGKLPSKFLRGIKQNSRMYFIGKHFGGVEKYILLLTTSLTKSLR